MKPSIATSTLRRGYRIPTTVRTVLFDAVGTLMFPHPSVAEAYLDAARQFGSRLELAEVGSRFRAAFGRQEQLDSDGGQRTDDRRERRRWQTIIAEVFPDATDQHALFQALWDYFAHPRHWKLFDDVPRAWARLQTRDVQLGVASNFDERLRSLIAGMPPLATTGLAFVSSELGWRKPAAGFFEAIERSLALRPEQILLVGDDLINDYFGARAVGWHAVLLTRQSAPPVGVEHWITSFDDLNTAS